MNSDQTQQQPSDKKVNIWEETINPDTGKSSIEIHKIKTVSVGCRENEHYFTYDGNPRRDAVCRKCKIISRFIVGYHDIKDGKIIKRV